MQNLEALANTYCPKELTRGVQKQIIRLSVINTLLAITAIVGNTVTLLALHKETSLQQPSKALIRNLVASDLCVGVVEPVFVAYWVSILQGRLQSCHVFFAIITP